MPGIIVRTGINNRIIWPPASAEVPCPHYLARMRATRSRSGRRRAKGATIRRDSADDVSNVPGDAAAIFRYPLGGLDPLGPHLAARSTVPCRWTPSSAWRKMRHGWARGRRSPPLSRIRYGSGTVGSAERTTARLTESLAIGSCGRSLISRLSCAQPGSSWGAPFAFWPSRRDQAISRRLPIKMPALFISVSTRPKRSSAPVTTATRGLSSLMTASPVPRACSPGPPGRSGAG